MWKNPEEIIERLLGRKRSSRKREILIEKKPHKPKRDKYYRMARRVEARRQYMLERERLCKQQKH